MKKLVSAFNLTFLTFTLVLSPFLAGQARANTSTLYINNFYGNGGTITSTNGLVNCSQKECTYSWNRTSGEGIVFNAAPKSGSKLYSFNLVSSGNLSCAEGSKSSKCTVSNGDTLTQAYVNWAYTSYNVSITKTGTGSGTVSGAGSYNADNNYTLGATPGADSVFAGWQTSGNICFAYSGGGKAGSPIVNKDSTCNGKVYYSSPKTLTAVAKFDKKSSDSSSSSTDSSDSSGSSSSANPADSGETISEPKEGQEATESLGSLTVNGEKFDPAKTGKMEFSNDQPIIFSGKTISNGIVTLYVYSEPKKYTATADKKGVWNIEVTGLPEGDHHAEIEVTDPKTKKTSKRTKLLEFSVKNAAVTAVPQTVSPAQKSLGSIIALAIGGLVLISALAAGLLYRFKPELFSRIKDKFKKTAKNPPAPPTMPSGTPPAQ